MVIRWVVFSLVSVVFLLGACAQPRIRRYEVLIEPRVNKAKKDEMAQVFGAPVKCEKVELFERCEYRTNKGRNDPTPETHRPALAGMPDLRPYEYFDVIHLYYDADERLKDWAPVSMK